MKETMLLNRKLSPTVFAGALLCFLLPFMQLSCGPIAINYSGTALMNDGDGTYDMPNSMDTPQKPVAGNRELIVPKELRSIAQPFTIAACVAIFAALVLGLTIPAFPNHKWLLSHPALPPSLVLLVFLVSREMSNPPGKPFKGTYGIGLWLIGITSFIGVVIT